MVPWYGVLFDGSLSSFPVELTKQRVNPHISQKRIDRAVWSLSKLPGLPAILGGSITSHSEPFHADLPLQRFSGTKKRREKKVCGHELILCSQKRGGANGYSQINSSGYGSSTVGGSMTIVSPGSQGDDRMLPRIFILFTSLREFADLALVHVCAG
jgi:hypothetical protein